MKASELRIGNWISTIYGMEFQVYPMAFKQMPTDEKHNLILDTWKPIPLTEEWLLKFGFEDVDLNMSGSNWLVKEQKGLWRQAIRIAYSEKSEEWSLTLECVSPPTLSISRLKYVHQLQNLYFALTGEELTFKSE